MMIVAPFQRRYVRKHLWSVALLAGVFVVAKLKISSRPQIQRRAHKCVPTPIKYIPSELEAQWLAEVRSLKSDDRAWSKGCDKVKAQEKEIRSFLAAIDALALPNSSIGVSSEQLSRFELRDSCSGRETTVYIEPLISFLRHPAALCLPEPHPRVLDKSYMLVPHVNEVTSENAYKWLFDAGASIYNEGAGGASQSWFVDTYRRRGIEFDRIFGWEAAKTDPMAQWTATPADIKRKTSWYNIPASPIFGHPDNPLTFIKSLTKVEDFVVFKLDIDSPEIEVALVHQIMQDPELLLLIDEFYFEHHVSGSPMQWHGWGDLTKSTTKAGDLQDSYTIFAFLRQHGIRAHSWV